MPAFNFVCPACSARTRKIAEKPPEVKCPQCGGAMERGTGTFGVSVVEVLDNGIMRRPVERLSDQPRLHREHIKTVESDKG